MRECTRVLRWPRDRIERDEPAARDLRKSAPPNLPLLAIDADARIRPRPALCLGLHLPIEATAALVVERTDDQPTRDVPEIRRDLRGFTALPDTLAHAALELQRHRASQQRDA